MRLAYPFLNRRQIGEALARGLCHWQGKKLKKGDLVAAGAQLDCSGLDAHLTSLSLGKGAPTVHVVADRSNYAVVDKPAGVKGHPLGLFDSDTMTQWAFRNFPKMLDEFETPLAVVTPHRLDTGTSGLLIVCKTKDSFTFWRDRFHRKEVMKSYEAWCWGQPERDEFTIDCLIAHSRSDRRKMVIVNSGAQYVPPVLASQSRIRVVERSSGSLFRAEALCRTGVTHQVRIHLASLGFPLVGDALYDGESSTRIFRPAHHLLRASSLDCEDNSFKAEMGPFRQMGAVLGEFR